MIKKFFAVVSLVTVAVTVSFSVQNRLTTHRLYFTGMGLNNGKIVYLFSQSGQSMNAWIMNEDGTNQMQITNDNLVKGAGDIFPDKTKAVMLEKDDNHDYLLMLNIDGTNKQTILTTELYLGNLKISPDQTKIAFTAADTINPVDNLYTGTLYIINIDGSGMKSLGLNNNKKPVALTTGVKMFSVAGSTLTQNITDVSEKIAFSSDSSKIAFINKDNCLSIISTDGAKIVTITTFSVSDIYWSKSDDRILFYYNDYYSGNESIQAINSNGSGYTTIYSTTSDIQSYSVSFDESKIAIMTSENNSNKCVIISTAGIILKEIPFVTDMPFIMNVAWVSNSKVMISDAKNLYTIDIVSSTPAPVNITNNTNYPLNLSIDAKSSKLVFTHDMKTIYTMNIDGTNEFAVITPNSTQMIAGNLLLSPNGLKLLYPFIDTNSINPCKLILKNSDGTGSETTIEENPSSSYYKYKFSPMGTKILFMSPIDYKYYVTDSNGLNKKPVIAPTDSGSYFTFSSDDNWIMFTGIVGGQEGIFKTDLSTTTVVFSTSAYLYNIYDWKSNKVLLSKYDSEKSLYLLYVMNDNGSGLTYIDVTNTPYYSKLSPDGTKLAFIQTDPVTGINKGLNVFNLSTSANIKLTDTAYPNIEKTPEFDWSPDNNKIVFTDFIRVPDIIKICVANADGTNKTILNSNQRFFPVNIKCVSSTKVVYNSGLDIWTDDLLDTTPFTVSVSALNFGEVKLGESKLMTFDIINGNTGNLTGTITSDKSWIYIGPTSINIDPGASLTVNVTVDNNVLNKGEGEHTGIITIATNKGNTTVVVNLTATCVLVSPNPFNPEKSNLSFFGDGIVPNNTKIKIYSLGGSLIKILEEKKGQSVIEWDGKNEDGNSIIDGIYIFVYESPKEKGIGKFTVIRK